VSAELQATITPGMIHVIELSLVGDLACAYHEGGMTRTLGLTAGPTPGGVMMSSQNARFSFDYLFIVNVGE
jgi:hypothetical protein